jgi:hypothetical protein
VAIQVRSIPLRHSSSSGRPEVGIVCTASRRVRASLLWVYSTDGLLSLGNNDENKHAVVGAGADVCAAGTVRVKLTEAEATFGRYLSDQQKVEFYPQREAVVAADTRSARASAGTRRWRSARTAGSTRTRRPAT